MKQNSKIKPIYGEKEQRMTDGIDAWDSAMRNAKAKLKNSGVVVINKKKKLYTRNELHDILCNFSNHTSEYVNNWLNKNL